jgi:hypothetical protein
VQRLLEVLEPVRPDQLLDRQLPAGVKLEQLRNELVRVCVAFDRRP